MLELAYLIVPRTQMTIMYHLTSSCSHYGIYPYRTVNSCHVFTQLKSKVEVDSGSAKSLHFWT